MTTDSATNLSFPVAPAKPARAEPSGNDSFSALVDSSTPVDSVNDRVAAKTETPLAAPQRRSNADATDSKPAGGDSAADRAGQKDQRDSKDRGGSDPTKDAGAGTEIARKPRGKSTVAKTGEAKSDEKPAADPAALTPATGEDVVAQPQAAVQATGTATPVAVAIAVPVVAAETAAVAAVPSQGQSPLAIAAAGIAAGAAVAADKPAATPVQVDSAEVTAATVIGETVAANAKAAAPVIAGKNDSTDKVATVAIDATQAADTAIAAPAAGALTGDAKAAPADAKLSLSKGSVPTPTLANTARLTPGDAERAQKAPDPSNTPSATPAPDATAPQPAATVQHTAARDAAVAGKPEPSATSAVALAAREHSTALDSKAGPADATWQPATTFQPLLQTSAATPSATLTATAAGSAAVPLSGVALEIAASAKAGKTSFEIRLDPADLGRIDVRIDVDRRGQVTSHLTVEKPETLTMLRQDAPQLQRALDDAGFKTGDGGLQFSLRDQSSSGQQDDGSRQGRQAQRLIVHDEDAIPATVAGRTYGRTLGSSSGVDIRI